MPITESKLKNGTLTLDAVEFGVPMTNVKVTPTHDEDGDPVETLSGDQLTPDVTRGNTLSMTAIQDWDNAAGFVNFTWLNDLETVPFVWRPKGLTGPSYSGNVEVRAVEVGGDVNKRITTEAEWTCEGPVIRTEAA